MEKLKSYGAHALSYALSVVALVAGTHPEAIPVSWLPWIGAAGIVLGGGHNAVVARVKAGDAAKALSVLLACILTVSILAGCASFTPQQRLVAQVAVQKSTGAYIKRAAHPDERAARVLAAVESIESLVADQTVTLEILESAALVYVNKVPDPLDRQMLADVVAGAVEELKTYAATGVLRDTDKLAVSRVLAWVKSAALVYIPKEA